MIDPIAELAQPRHGHGTLCHVDACLGGWLLPVLGGDRRAGPAVELLGRGRHLDLGRHPQVRLLLQGCLDRDLPRRGDEAPPALHLRRLARRHLRLGDHRRHPPAAHRSRRRGRPSSISAATATWRRPAPFATRPRLFLDGVRLDRRAAGDRRRPTCRLFEFSSREGTEATGAIGDVMDDRGWHLDRQQGGLHLMISPGHLAVADTFVADLADAVANRGVSRGVEAQLRRRRRRLTCTDVARVELCVSSWRGCPWLLTNPDPCVPDLFATRCLAGWFVGR